MPDAIFEHPRLVAVYDSFDGQRTDLEHYVALAKELGARAVLDVGCGTGCFAQLLAAQGFEVIGLEPARASLEFARSKLSAANVRWICGVATQLPPLAVDLAVLTGNVAQVFLSDEEWENTLRALRKAIRTQGHLVFEVRDPAQQAWVEWTPEKTRSTKDLPGIGRVESWCELTKTEGELISFRWTYRFEADGEVFTSDSTIRFRSQAEIEASLEDSGYQLLEVRGAPDRPAKEFVFIAKVP